MSSNLITATGVTLAFDGHTAAENVNFTLGRGDYLCVIGENGSGKSTLLRAVTGEVRPAGGKLDLAPELRKAGIGYLPQQSKIQRDFPATVREVVVSGCVRRDSVGLFWKKESRERAADYMQLLKVDAFADKSFGELSGGQRQRVLLARAMCASDTLILLDEPVNGLDPDAAHEMYHAVRMLNRERGCAVMMVSHDVSCALREADHVLSMCRGHSFYGTVAEYAAHEQLDNEHDEHLHRHDHEHHHGGEHHVDC